MQECPCMFTALIILSVINKLISITQSKTATAVVFVCTEVKQSFTAGVKYKLDKDSMRLPCIYRDAYQLLVHLNFNSSSRLSMKPKGCCSSTVPLLCCISFEKKCDQQSNDFVFTTLWPLRWQRTL